MRTNKKVLILDIDHTLIEGSSWVNTTKALGCSVENHLQILEKLKKGQIQLLEAKSALISLWSLNFDLTRENLNRKINSSIKFVEGVSGLSALIKEYNLQPILISGGFDLYVDMIGKKLNITQAYSGSKFIFSDEKLIDFEFTLDQNFFKLGVINSLRNELDFTNSIAIGDGDTDEHVFKHVDLAVQVGNILPNINQPNIIAAPDFKSAINLLHNMLRT